MKTILYLLSFRTKKALSHILEKKFAICIFLIPIIAFTIMLFESNFMLKSQWEHTADKQFFIFSIVKKGMIQMIAYLLFFSVLYWLFNRIFKQRIALTKNLTVVSLSTFPLILGGIIILIAKYILANVDDYIPYVGWDEYSYTLIRFLTTIWSTIIIFKGNRLIVNNKFAASLIPTIIYSLLMFALVFNNHG